MENINGHLVLLMGPMGSGKGTLVRHAKETFPELQFAVSCTTRDKRDGEVDGREYHFISPEEFEQKIQQTDFLEYAEFSGNKYGTLKAEITDRLTSGQVVLNEIELQGVEQLLPLIPVQSRTLIYVESGSWDALEARAISRAPISAEHLALRKERYTEEVKMKPYADVVLTNTDGQLEEAKNKLEHVLQNIFNSINT